MMLSFTSAAFVPMPSYPSSGSGSSSSSSSTSHLASPPEDSLTSTLNDCYDVQISTCIHGVSYFGSDVDANPVDYCSHSKYHPSDFDSIFNSDLDTDTSTNSGISLLNSLSPDVDIDTNIAPDIETFAQWELEELVECASLCLFPFLKQSLGEMSHHEKTLASPMQGSPGFLHGSKESAGSSSKNSSCDTDDFVMVPAQFSSKLRASSLVTSACLESQGRTSSPSPPDSSSPSPSGKYGQSVPIPVPTQIHNYQRIEQNLQSPNQYTSPHLAANQVPPDEPPQAVTDAFYLPWVTLIMQSELAFLHLLIL
ncbi:hypothetical protein JD844_014819 [Phrynosoma platyrhinos]|uniref:Uncharacterized protein n=1 Tax=Phrynosoma platyrhinos TaxID=52577 RepID=A0ABQ7T6I6_PHRPL|nr:hypothetical protein JD844_014819 [Phrynosoma platyrhinos]